MHQQMLLSSSASFPAQATWDPSLIAASITLSNSNRDAEGNANNAGVALSTGAKTTGDFYVEVELMSLANVGQTMSFAMGLYNATTGLTSFLGGNVNGFGTWVEGSGNLSRSSYNNNIQSNLTAGNPAPTVGIRARMAVKVGIGVWLGRWGTTVWLGGGDPIAGTSPTYSLSAGTFRMAANPRGTACRIRLVDPANWANPIPGFGVWTP